MAGPAITSTEEAVAAFSDYMDESGEFGELTQENDTQETPQDEDNAAEDEEILDEEEVEDTADGELDANEGEDEGLDESEEGDEGDEEGQDLSAIDTLAEYFDMEPDDVLSAIQVEDPFGNQISMSEAMDGWRQSEASVNARKSELEKQFSEQRSEYDAQATKAVGELAATTKLMIEEMQQAYRPEALQQLRDHDPEEYVRMMERKHELDSKIQQSIALIEQEGSRQGQHSEEDMKRLLADEHSKMLDRIPEWRDDKRRSAAMGVATTYLKETIGFSDEDVASIHDHRLMLILRDAVVGHQLRQGGDSKRVAELSRKGLKKPALRLKGQTRRDPENRQKRDRAKARSRLQKTGSVEDAAANLMDLID